MTPRDAWHDPATVARITRAIHGLAESLPRPITFMEVCGTHTHAIAAAGLRRLLPANVRLVSGPGCPVCVTPVDYLDHALALAALRDVTITTFGDLMRVPASRRHSLEQASAAGADVRMVYSPRDALRIAEAEPARRVVFLAVGFETTVPTIAAALQEAETLGIGNFLLLSGSKVIEPPLRALVQASDVKVDGFLLPGHVSVVLGADAYRFLTDECGVPGVIVGFTPVEVQLGIRALLQQVLTKRPAIENRYARVVSAAGNRAAKALIARFFTTADTRWRGLGTIPGSGLVLRPEWRHRDAACIPVELPAPLEPKGCRCGEVLKGAIEPPSCPLFGRGCTPEHAVGACMVSSEGTCAAWYRHERWAPKVVTA